MKKIKTVEKLYFRDEIAEINCTLLIEYNEKGAFLIGVSGYNPFPFFIDENNKIKTSRNVLIKWMNVQCFSLINRELNHIYIIKES